jgi:PKD repeat protein
MHPIGQNWADNHGDLVEDNSSLRSGCANCHGAAGKGTVLSRMQHTRTIPTKENKYGTKNYWRGRTVSCYDCHNGPNESDPSTHPPAVAQTLSTNTTSGASVALTLQATGAGTKTYRIVSQPAHGSVGVSNNVATYFPDPGYVGTDQFTFTAFNTWVDSNLATGSVTVAQGPFSISARAQAPPSWPTAWVVPFSVAAVPSNILGEVSYDWDFGDGLPHSSMAHPAHAYAAAGTYSWSVISTVRRESDVASTTNTGTLVISGLQTLSLSPGDNEVTVAWPNSLADTILEFTRVLGPTAPWSPVSSRPVATPGTLSVTVPADGDTQFFRVRRVY